MSEQQEQPGISDTASPAQPGRMAGIMRRFNMTLVIALIAVVLLVWMWLDTRRHFITVETDLARRLAQFDTRSSESRLLAGQSQEDTREALVKLGLLEQKLTESQNQQVALEAMYQELSKNRDESTLAEIEQVLLLASQQLQLAGNVKAALIALQTADARLQRMDKPQLLGLRKAINKDIERLRALPYVDVAGLSLRLDELIESAGELPLLPGRATQPAKTAARPGENQTWWRQLGGEAWLDFTQLVRIQNMEKPELPLLPPSQTFFVRENLKLRLLTARLALLQHDEASYKADLKTAEAWLNHYFDTRDKAVKNALASLHQLSGSPVSIETQDISASLSAVRSYKTAQERGGR